MSILLRAAIAAASFASITPAHAGINSAAIPHTRTAVAVQVPAWDARGVGTGYVMRAYVTETKRGTWRFAPHDGGGANS